MTQIRNILDPIGVTSLFAVFEWVYHALHRGGQLKRYECLGRHLLVTLDGTQYFSSHKIHCERCSTRTHKNGTTTYFHSAILPVIVAPSLSAVITLTPEFITPQDGSDKQDCEVTAAKRWISPHAQQCTGQPITLLGDDLYSRQPMVEQCRTENENHNVLKTKGYHLEHNFGHGKDQLAPFLLTLNLLAFLFHTVLQLVDAPYQQIRHQRGTRKGFFQDILSLLLPYLSPTRFSAPRSGQVVRHCGQG